MGEGKGAVIGRNILVREGIKVAGKKEQRITGEDRIDPRKGWAVKKRRQEGPEEELFVQEGGLPPVPLPWPAGGLPH